MFRFAMAIKEHDVTLKGIHSFDHPCQRPYKTPLKGFPRGKQWVFEKRTVVEVTFFDFHVGANERELRFG